MFCWIYLSILQHIRTSTRYHVLLDIPFHTSTHSYFYWISCSTGYTFPYLNTFVLLLNMLYVFNISRSTRKGASRNLGSNGVLHWLLRNIGRNARSLHSLSLEIINLHFKFGCTFIYCTQELMRTSKVMYPIPCLPNNLIQINSSAARHRNSLPLFFFGCLHRLITRLAAKTATEIKATTIHSQCREWWDTSWLGSWYVSLTLLSFVRGWLFDPNDFPVKVSVPVKNG